MGFVGRSSWRQVIAANVFAASGECEAPKQTGASLGSTGVMGGISFLIFVRVVLCCLQECFVRPGSLLYLQLGNRKMGIL